MRGFWCSGDSTSQRILDVLESGVAVVKFRMNDRSDRVLSGRLFRLADSNFIVCMLFFEAY